jgi:phospholipid/cholesterol/gamma-HCH transport system ATP-binding protein
MVDAGHHDGGTDEIEGVPPQVMATPGMPERKAVGRRQARVREIMHTLPPAAQEAIRDSLDGTDNRDRNGHGNGAYADDATTSHRRVDEEAPTASIPVQREA